MLSLFKFLQLYVFRVGVQSYFYCVAPQANCVSSRLREAAEYCQPCCVASGLCMQLNVLCCFRQLNVLSCFRLVHAAECSQACCVAAGLWEAAQSICSSGDATERWLVAAP